MAEGDRGEQKQRGIDGMAVAWRRERQVVSEREYQREDGKRKKMRTAPPPQNDQARNGPERRDHVEPDHQDGARGPESTADPESDEAVLDEADLGGRVGNEPC